MPSSPVQRTLDAFLNTFPSSGERAVSREIPGLAREGFSLLPGLLRQTGRKEIFWVLTSTPERALRLVEEIRSAPILLDLEPDVLLFPEEEVLPYERESPADFIRAERIHALDRLASPSPPDVVVSPVAAVLRKTLSPPLLKAVRRTLQTGMEEDPRSVVEALLSQGYVRVPQVTAPGEFSV